MSRPPMGEVAVVVPTVGRPSLQRLLSSLTAAVSASGLSGPEVVVVDDRPAPDRPLCLPGEVAGGRLVGLASGGRGPAAARNLGWRATEAPWICFLDDDVEVRRDWWAALHRDLASLTPAVAEAVGGSQGRLVVPLAPGRRPTDWERNVKGLEDACWATADLVYRRQALEAVGGFDERFGRAYREDADLGLRVTGSGWLIVRGRRTAVHPVRPADRFVSIRAQRGNADDELMRARHGADWRRAAAAGPGRSGRHLVITAAGVWSVVSLLRARRRAALVGGSLWAAGTAEFLWARLSPGPRQVSEVVTMTVSSLAIPPVATWHRLRGFVLHRLLRPVRRWQPAPWRRSLIHGDERPSPRAVLFDRDGTLVHDVPYNGDPDLVSPMPGAAEALQRLREKGVALGVVTNQSGVARGVLRGEDVAAVQARVEQLLGPFDTWQVCPHGEGDGCGCRKPAPGLVQRACEEMAVEPAECVVIGDIASDVEAARAAGARGILVPTSATRPEEVDRAEETAPDLLSAVERLVGGGR